LTHTESVDFIKDFLDRPENSCSNIFGTDEHILKALKQNLKLNANIYQLDQVNKMHM